MFVSAGCNVSFATVTTAPSKVILSSTGQVLPGFHDSGPGKMSEWKEVVPGGEVPFEFSSGEKLRHRVSFVQNYFIWCTTSSPSAASRVPLAR